MSRSPVAHVAVRATRATGRRTAGRVVLALGLLAALPALAGSAAPGSALFSAKRIGDRVLARQSGGTDVASDTRLQGSVSDNQAVNVSTGANQITGGALAGAAGIPVVIQNTGNNVLIQSATIVNVQVK